MVLWLTGNVFKEPKENYKVMKVLDFFHFPLSPSSDQHQISPCNINAYSTLEVMRINKMTVQSEFS